MKLGMVGLGRMGANMARRLMAGGHQMAVYDPLEDKVEELVREGADGAASLDELVALLEPPRSLWLMVPAGEITGQTINTLAATLQSGDTLIDGGNSHYTDSRDRYALLHQRDVGFIDVGTSGGVWGLEEGYSMSVGGDTEAVQRHRSLFETLAPAPDRGWGHVGPAGAGHFVKMVHNGIEYGIMQAYAEGFAIMKAKPDYDISLRRVADVWSHGSVVRSWLLELIGRALADDEDLEGIKGWVPDTGEGRWTVKESIDLDVAAPVITLALQRRFRSREGDAYADRLLAALRNQFGGHDVKKA